MNRPASWSSKIFGAAVVGSILLGAVATSSAAVIPGITEVIVQTGDPAPDGNGTFSDLLSPGLNEAGQVAFRGYLTGTGGGLADDEGVFRGAGGAIAQVAREGQPAPDGNGTFSSFGNMGLNDAGQVAFRADLIGTTGGSTDDRGVFREDGGAITQIAREGQPAPDGNGTFSYLNYASLNNLGQVAFHASLTGTSGGSTDDGGIFRGQGGGLTQIVRQGQAVPDGNGTYHTLHAPLLNDAGQVAFDAYLTGTSGGAADNDGVFRGEGGSITQIARAGQSVPDGNGKIYTPHSPAFNNAGQAVFDSYLTGTSGGSTDNDGVFSGAGGALTQIARGGQSAPDGNGTFYSFTETLSINDADQTAFRGYLEGTSAGTDDNYGIFRGSGGAITQIVREGQPAPDGNGTFNMPYYPSLNSAGLVAFSASLRATSGGTADDGGLYLGDGIELVQLARKGQPLAGSTVSSIQFMEGSLNDFAQVAYLAELVNGDEVIVRATPEVHWRSTNTSYWTTTSNWTLGIDPAAVHPVCIDPNASLSVYGPTSDTTVRSLQVGGGAGLASLRLRYGAAITAPDGVTIESTGTVTGDGILDAEVTNFGEIAGDNITVTGPALTNHGVIRGPGRLTATLANSTDGEIRVASGQTLRLAGPSLDNEGRVEIFGGELEVLGTATNGPDGSITVRDSVLRFKQGLDNQGQMGFSFGSTNDLFGDVSQSGRIAVAGGALVAIHDDLDLFEGSTTIVAAAGSTVSELIIFGTLSGDGSITGGGNVYILGGLSPGHSPGELAVNADLYLGNGVETCLELADQSTYDQLRVAGDLALAGQLKIDLLDGFSPSQGDTFDLLDWNGLSGSFSQVSLPDLSPGLRWDASELYASGTLSVVPEPGTLLLLAAAALMLVVWRRRGSSKA